jgi:hypothetical protein
MGSVVHASPVVHQVSSSNCPTIPANFDFAHASKQQLHQYLLPARPPASDKQGTIDWQKGVVRTIKTGGICISDLKTSSVSKVYNTLVDCFATAPSGTSCNGNWTGYVAGDGTQPGFNEVKGQWNVECVNGLVSASTARMSSWIGLGGAYGDNLWQVGSAWDRSRGYYLWYETIVAGSHNPSPPVKIANTSCGHHISADIWFAPNAPSSGLGLYLTDNGTPYRDAGPSGFSSGSLSAEWIDERPACGLDRFYNPLFYQLADYNYSDWTNAYDSPNNPTAPFYSIGQLAHTREWLVALDGSNTRIAWADYLGSEVGSGTDNFKTHWESNGDNEGC